MHVIGGMARFFERSVSNDAQLMRDWIVIDDTANVRFVRAGFSDQVEHNGAKIGAGAGQQVDVRRHVREVGQITAALIGLDVLEHQRCKYQVVPACACLVPVADEIVYALGREGAAPIDHCGQVEPFDARRDRFQIWKVAAEPAAEIENGIDSRGNRDRRNVRRERLAGFITRENPLTKLICLARGNIRPFVTTCHSRMLAFAGVRHPARRPGPISSLMHDVQLLHTRHAEPGLCAILDTHN
jgi:hypothetical protein